MADERIVIDVEAETRKFQAGLKKAADSTRKFGDRVRDQMGNVRHTFEQTGYAAFQSIAVNLSKAQRHTRKFVKDTGARFDRLKGKFQSTGKALGTSFVFTPTDIVNGVRAINDFVNATADAVSEMDMFAKSTGLSIETIAGLKQAAEFTGKELTELIPLELSKKIQEAGTGAGEAAVLFKAVGVNVKDAGGQLKSADVVFREVLDGLNGLGNEAEKAALASKILGEQGAKLLSTLDDSDSLNNFVELAAQYGTDVGPEAVRITKEWQKGTAMLSTSFDGAKGSLFEAFGGPASIAIQGFSVTFTFFVEVIKEGLKVAGERLVIFNRLISGDLSAAKDLVEKTGSVFTDLRGAIEAAGITTYDFMRQTSRASAAVKDLNNQQNKGGGQGGGGGGQGGIERKIKKLLNLSEIEQQLAKVQATEQEKRLIRRNEEIAKIAELTEATVDGFLAGKITSQQLEAFNAQALDRTKRSEQDYTDWLAEQQRIRTEDAALAEEERLELLEKTMAARRELTKEERIENRKTAANSVQMEIGKAKAITDSVSATTSAIMDSLNTRTRKGRDGARKVFRAQKAANIASITMDAAAGAARAFRDLPFPVAAITSGLAFAAAIAQISVVAKQRPKFHVGTRAASNAPDETNATITKNEAVITPQAMETVANLNAGANPTTAPMMLQIDHKAFDMTVKRLARIPSTSTAQLIANKTPPGRRSRRK